MKEIKRIKARMLIRRDSSENWLKSNPVLMQGEMGYDITIKNFKIGDGESHWNDLPFFGLQQDNISNAINYNLHISHKPQIESHELIGNKTFKQLGISPIEIDTLLNILN